MKLLNKMFRAGGLPPSENIGGDQVTVSDSESVYIVGHKGLKEFTPCRISARMRGYEIEIVGENLKVVSVNDCEAMISGKIFEVKRCER